MGSEIDPKPPRWRRINPLLSIVLSVLLTIALRFVVERTWSYLSGFWDAWSLRTLGTLSVLLAGSLLYLFKKHYQKRYGLSEVGFALTVSWLAIAKAQSEGDAASWVPVIAAAYLIVRGLTNYEEGKKKEAV